MGFADPGLWLTSPERLLRALLLQAFYGIRSERQIMEGLEFDLLFRWFGGLGIDDAARDQTTFGKNRDRLLAGDVADGRPPGMPATRSVRSASWTMSIARSTLYADLSAADDDTAVVEAIARICEDFEQYGWRLVRAALRQ